MKASSRSLGGGRILGSGRSLSPALPPPPPSNPTSPAAPQHKRNASLLSPAPSESSRSEQGSNNESPATTIDAQDLGSRVSLGKDEHVSGGQAAVAAAATSRLVCPICNEEMVTLLQLNR